MPILKYKGRYIPEHCYFGYEGECTSCESGYEKYNMSCYLVIPNCAEYDDSGCTKCDANYELFNN